MKTVVIFLILPALLLADHLEVRRKTKVYEKPTSRSATVTTLSAGVILSLDDDSQSRSYYAASTLDGISGFVPRSYVRRIPGDPPARNTTAVAPWTDIGDDLSETEKAWARRHYSIGKPQALIQRVREGYALAHDSRLKIPVWVQYEISPDDLDGAADRQDDFRPDYVIPRGSRSELSDYVGSGFDRGHMAPAADMKRTEETMSESFFLSNMAPQVGNGFNRKIWADLEAAIRGWVRQRGTLTVITGPVFAVEGDTVNYQVIGDNAVAVPTHFFKIVVDNGNPNAVEALAFLLPNRSLSGHSFDEFLVSIDEIEKATGLDFLSALPSQVQKQVESNARDSVW